MGFTHTARGPTRTTMPRIRSHTRDEQEGHYPHTPLGFRAWPDPGLIRVNQLPTCFHPATTPPLPSSKKVNYPRSVSPVTVLFSRLLPCVKPHFPRPTQVPDSRHFVNGTTHTENPPSVGDSHHTRFTTQITQTLPVPGHNPPYRVPAS